MGLIGDAKHDLARATEQEAAACAHLLKEVRERLLVAADEAQGLNGLDGKFRAIANALEVEEGKIGDAATDTMKKLGVSKEPITQSLNADLAKSVVAAKRAEEIRA